MSIDPNKRKSFDAVAEIYNEVRTGYPEMLVEDILSLSRIPDKGRILEIGCGSGNATVAFARRGYTILGIELGANLAALAVLKEALDVLHSINLDAEAASLRQSPF